MCRALSPKRACALCGARSCDLFQQADDPYRVAQCKKCTLVYVDPFPPRTELEQHYDEDYYSLARGIYNLTGKNWTMAMKAFATKGYSEKV